MSELFLNNSQTITEYAAETIVYFERHKLLEIAKKILVECALYRPKDVQLWIGENIKRIAAEIYADCLSGGRNGDISLLNMTGHFLYRVVIFGRRGSGRKTQAFNLVKRFNLVYIDAELLIYQNLRGDDDDPNEPLARELQRAFYYNNCEAKCKAIANIIARRILWKDALHQGWVLVNYPNSLTDIREVFENWKVPPNKLLYLQCNETTCMRRLVQMPDIGNPQQNHQYFEHEMLYFNKNMEEIEKYLKRRYETIYINSELCSEEVKTQVLTLIQKTPYLMGFKQDDY